MTKSFTVLTLVALLGFLCLVQPIGARASSTNVASPEPMMMFAFTCPATDSASFPLGPIPPSDAGNPLFCSYPAFAGENPTDFYCTYSVTTGALVTDNDAGFCPADAAGSAPLTAPSFTKAFGGATVPAGGTTTFLTFTIVNPNATPLTGLAFTDTLPSGFFVASPNGLADTCGGTVTATAGGISLSGGTLAASSTCTISANVLAFYPGNSTNITSTLTSNAPTAPAATASIYVTESPTFSKAFGVGSIFTGSATTLTFTIVNPNTVLVTGLSFTDALPVGLIVANPNGVADTCGGTVTATAGSGSVSLSGGTLAASSTCTISVSVLAISAGNQINTTSTLTSITDPTASPATASIIVFPAHDSTFQISYAADPSAGESYVNIINTGANGAPPLGPGLGAATGNTCVNVYAVDPSEELIACCSCLLTPNQVMNLGVNADLTIKTETGVVPPSVTIKLVNTLAGPTGTATSCTNSATSAGGAGFPLAVGMVAYGTTPQAVGTVYNQVEHPFIPSTLSAAELTSLTGRCSSIIGNASGYGICLSCRSGALGATKQ